MIKELLEWEIKNSKLENIAKDIDRINVDFTLLDAGLAQTCDANEGVGVVNPYRAQRILKQIKKTKKKINDVNIEKSGQGAKFTDLVKKKFNESLDAQEEYIKFFVTNVLNYGRNQGGVKSFLNNVFPSWQLPGMKRKGALAFLEHKTRNLDYEALTRREDLMSPIEMNEVLLNAQEYEELHFKQFPLLRDIIGGYAIHLDFETKDQIAGQNLIAQKKKLEAAKGKISDLFGSGEAKLPKRILDEITGKISDLSQRTSLLDTTVKDLFYNIVLNWEGSCAYDCKQKVMEVGAQKFHFYDDKGEIKFYAGDIARSGGHEYLHKAQGMIGKHLALGLKEEEPGYNFAGRVMIEGVPTFFEDHFLDWLESNKQQYEISKEDIERASLFEVEWDVNKLTRFLHAVYERQYGTIEDAKKKGHLKLAEVTGVQTCADDDMLPTESLSEIYYFAMYFFGKQEVKRTMNKLLNLESKALGDVEKARAYLRKNENIIIQGMLTGNWGWKTHGRFFLEHYWPEARQYCKEV